jgi:membrane protein DedA with SNARE-associated domain
MSFLANLYIIMSAYPYLVIFLAVLIEGPLATILAGFWLAQGLINPFLVFIIVIVADLLGDIFYYYLGRSGRKFGKRLFKKKSEKLLELEDYLKNNSGQALLIGKFAHGIGALFIFAAGAARIPIGKFLFFNTLGTIPKSIILMLVGYFFGQSYLSLTKYADIFGLGTLAIGLTILLIYFLSAKKIKKKKDL